jgi:hypothetical protein
VVLKQNEPERFALFGFLCALVYERKRSTLEHKKTPAIAEAHFLSSGRQDSNLRPPGPKPGALPACATSRDFVILIFAGENHS